jgi:DNA repair protein RadC
MTERVAKFRASAKGKTRVAVFRRCVLVEEKRVRYESSATTFGPLEASRLVRALTGNSPTEWVVAMYLSSAGKFVGAEVVGRGGSGGCGMTVADVLRGAIVSAASSLILAHNHPSGDARPSDQDVRFTRDVQQAAELVGLKLLDHIIVTTDDFRSMATMGHL